MASGHSVTPSPRHPIIRAALYILQITVVLLFAGYMLSFADHVRQLFGFPFPLDYGEGPLVMQVDQLRSGTPIWQLYTDPSAPPFLIINYPPVYLLLTAALSTLLGSTLLAGRLIALLSTLSVVVALGVLAQTTDDGRRTTDDPAANTRRLRFSVLGSRFSALGSRFSVHRSALLPALLFLTIPIVREWAVLMRVDLLGIALGLWGLVIVRRGGFRAITLGGLLIVASLCTKPSLLAAPLAAGGWLLWRVFRAGIAERRAALRDLIVFAGVVGASGMLVVGGLQWASGGWFWLHVVAANANRWEADLAWGFWRTQLQLRWPLVVLAGVAVWAVVRGRRTTDDGRRTCEPQYHPLSPCPLVPLSPCPNRLLLPLLYTLGGVITAIGVGKVGAYSNYFLELYAGLIWLIALGAQVWPFSIRRPQRAQWPIWLLLTAALAYYPPLWDPDRLRPAGLIEPNPPRLAFGSYGLWADARRETAVLGALTRVNAALAADVRAAGSYIFTDLPGVAAAAGVGSRLQAFEARQLLDQGLADETALRSELANGELPLAVIDFLGNWLTPEVVELLQRRYAHDGSWGTFDMFRPVDAGPALPINANLPLAGGAFALNAYSLAAPLGVTYEPGELLTLALHFERTDAVDPDAPTPLVEVQLRDDAGRIMARTERPLLYGALHPATWPVEGVLEHFQPFSLPANLPAGRYTLAVAVRADDQDLGVVVNLTALEVGALGGQLFTETGHFVPAPLLERWTDLGGRERIGLPLTPLTPFAWGRLQCFEYACLEWRDQQVQLRNLGERLYVAETQRAPLCADEFCAGFTAAAERYSQLGTPISGAVRRNGWIVQWTTTTRLERAPEGGPIGIGRLGDDSLRLAPGMRYRWP
jgi:hypothetical protein